MLPQRDSALAWCVVLALGPGCDAATMLDVGDPQDAGQADGGDASRPFDAAARDAGLDGRPMDAGFDAASDAELDARADDVDADDAGSIDASTDASVDAPSCVLSFDGFASRLAVAYCAMVSRCGLERELEARRFREGLTDCALQLTTVFANAPYYARYREALDRGTMTFHGCDAIACSDAVAAQACLGRESRLPTAVHPACGRMFAGTIPDGARCTLEEECLDASVCRSAGGPCPGGTCEHAPQLGEPCGSGPACALGLYCRAGLCEPELASGAPCDPRPLQFPCAGRVRCIADASGDPSSGTCGPYPARGAGAPCDAPVPYGICDVGLVCAPDSATSSACRTPRTDGTCQTDNQITTADCPLGQACMVTTGRDGTCVPLCSGSACTTPRVNGDACTTGSQCLSGYCSTGRCASEPLCPAP